MQDILQDVRGYLLIFRPLLFDVDEVTFLSKEGHGLHLEARYHGRGYSPLFAFYDGGTLILLISVFAFGKGGIVELSTTGECPVQFLFRCGVGIQAIFVGLHHDFLAPFRCLTYSLSIHTISPLIDRLSSWANFFSVSKSSIGNLIEKRLPCSIRIQYITVTYTCQESPSPITPHKERRLDPWLKRLILTHILQMDFVKWPIKPSRMAAVSQPLPSRSALQAIQKRCG